MSVPESPLTTELSDQYDTPLGLSHSSMEELKDRIQLHYDVASTHYLKLWGEQIHHGFWVNDSDSKETAQVNLIKLLVSISGLPKDSRVLDVGCGVGGSSRYLASEMGCCVTGITISSEQVKIANELTTEAAQQSTIGQHELNPTAYSDADGFSELGQGIVRFQQLDAEKMDGFLDQHGGTFDLVWIVEALSHFPNKQVFFDNAFKALKPGGKIILADWAKAEGLSTDAFQSCIKPIEDGMLLPPLCTQSEYVDFAIRSGFGVYAELRDISKEVSRTWDISWSLVQKPALWSFALSQGRDGIAFLQSFRAMRQGYSDGSFRYIVTCFQKPSEPA